MKDILPKNNSAPADNPYATPVSDPVELEDQPKSASERFSSVYDDLMEAYGESPNYGYLDDSDLRDEARLSVLSEYINKLDESDREPTFGEEAVLEAYEADLEVMRASNKYDYELLSLNPYEDDEDYLRGVIADAKYDAKPEDKRHWRDMDRLVQDYMAMLRGEDNTTTWHDDRSTKDAEGLLSHANNSSGEIKKVLVGTEVLYDPATVKNQARLMRQQANMFRFIGEALRQRSDEAEGGSEIDDTKPEKHQEIAVPEDWRERRDFMNNWFANHSTDLNEDNLEVARQFMIKEAEMYVRVKRDADEKNKENKESSKSVISLYAGNVSGLFGASASVGVIDPVQEVMMKACIKHQGLDELSSADYATMKIDAVAEALGIDLHELVDGYEDTFNVERRQR